MQPSMETFRAWFAALAEEDRRRAARFALFACRRALPVWEEIYVSDPRPRAALDLVEAWLDDKVPAGAVSEAAPGLINPSPSGWRAPSVFAGDAIRQLVGAVPALEVAALTATVEDAITSLDQNWRWRLGCPSQIGEELRRVFLGLPLAAAGLPRFRVEKEESTGGDLFEIEYRREFWVVDGWTGRTVLYLSGETSGRLISGTWGDLSTGGIDGVEVDGDHALVQSSGATQRVDLLALDDDLRPTS